MAIMSKVFLDYDQAALDAAYDQAAYAPNRDQILARFAHTSELARRRLGAPERFSYGEKPIEGLDLYRTKKPNAPIQNEADNGLKNERGTVAMARTSDPNSATSQFFVNVKDNGFLDHTAPNAQGWGYCVFGKVVEGRDVIDEIKQVKTGKRGAHAVVSVEDVIIERAEVV